MYHLRISSQEDGILAFVKIHTVRAVMVYEMADEEVSRDHSHTVIMEFLNVKPETFRKNLLIKFPHLKNRNHSFKKIKEDEEEKSIRYICKGKQDSLPICVINTADIDIEKQYQDYWIVNRSLQKSKSKQKEISKNFLTKCIERYQEKIKTGELDNRHRLSDSDLLNVHQVQAYYAVMEVYGDTPKGLDELIIRRAVYGILNSQDETKQRFREDFYHRVFSR